MFNQNTDTRVKVVEGGRAYSVIKVIKYLEFWVTIHYRGILKLPKLQQYLILSSLSSIVIITFLQGHDCTHCINVYMLMIKKKNQLYSTLL